MMKKKRKGDHHFLHYRATKRYRNVLAAGKETRKGEILPCKERGPSLKGEKERDLSGAAGYS